MSQSSKLSDKPVLVTGCAGFLGPWVCQLLLDMGVTVVGLDRNFKPLSRIHDLLRREMADGSGGNRLKLIDVDIEDYQKLHSTLRDYKIGAVFHLAAQALVGVANHDPVPTFAANIVGTYNLMEACRVLIHRGQAIDAIVVASSDKAYGDQVELPYLEDAPMQGRFPYDVSKSCADLIARSYFHSYDLPVAVTRCGNLYGGGDINYSRIVPGTILSVLRDERPEIRSDGTPVRDYIYVGDAARANIAIAERMLADRSIAGMPFNISNDAPVAVLDIVAKILSLMDREDLEPVVHNQATGEIQAQYLSSERMRTVLGWQPEYDLERGLRESIDWYRDFAVRKQMEEI